jgi:quinol monooxygenase YgiN
MQPLPILVLGLMVCVFGAPQMARAEDKALYVVTYLEVVQSAADATAQALSGEAALSRKAVGLQEMRVLRETGRSTRFAILENWADRAAFEAHEQDPHVKDFQSALAAMETAPRDRRMLTTLWRSSAPAGHTAAAVWVVTHVDVTPPNADKAAAMLETLASASAKEAGGLRFDAMRQADRANHFTLEEAWADEAAFAAHQTGNAAKSFRMAVGPLLGALYDQRIYRTVDALE